jgi:hypothetical protein
VFQTLSEDPKGEELFPGVSIENNEEMFNSYTRAFASVVTRCFGWSLPCTMVVPFADFINHHNVDSSYELINKNWRPQPPPDKEEVTAWEKKIEEGTVKESDKFGDLEGPLHYYTTSKSEIDYSMLFDEEKNTEEFNEGDLLPRSINYKKMLKARSDTYSQGLTKLKASSWFEIWDTDYMSTSDEEDDDNEESSDESSDEDKKDQVDIDKFVTQTSEDKVVP